jgi:hypothetical protein
MFTEDYILRMIRMASMVMARILGFKRAGQYDRAFQEIDQALEQLLGLPHNLIYAMDDDSLLDLFVTQEQLDIDRLWLVADLFKENGEMWAQKGNPAESRLHYQRAMTLYLEGALHGGSEYLPEPQEKITGICELLGLNDLALKTLDNLFYYFEQVGDYARSELALDRLMKDPAFRDEFQEERGAFYGRLLEKSDEELARGGVTRVDVARKAGV